MTTSNHHHDADHASADLPEEIAALYREQLISAEELAPMTQLRDELMQSAPPPRDDFQAQLAERLKSELPPTRHSPVRRLIPKRRAARIALLAAVLIIGVGTALAVSVLMQRFTDFDAGFKAIFEQGRGHEIYGVSQTIEDYTVSVEWAYADGNRLIVAFMIQGRPGEQYTNLSNNLYTLRQRSTGVKLPLQQGFSAMIDQNGEILGLDPNQPSTSDRNLSVYTYDLSGITIGDSPTLDLQFELDAYGITVQQRTLIPDVSRFEELRQGPEEHFLLDFSVPLVNDQRVFNTPITATDQDVTITLTQASVSPSQTRVLICFPPPDPARQWTAIPRLTTASGEVPGGGGVNTFMDGELACSDFTYNAGMYDYNGEWQLEITELVGFGSGGGSDQQRIAGSWKFAFTVP